MDKSTLMLHPEYCAKLFNEINNEKDKAGIDDFIASIDDQVLKAKLILSMPINNDAIRKSYYNQIDDRFLKACVTISDANMGNIFNGAMYEVDSDKLVESSRALCRDIDIYMSVMQRLETCTNDNERVALITNPVFFQGIDYKLVNNIKHSIMYNIEDSDLRMQIINSMENTVSPELRELNECAQTIILNLFEKAYNGKIPPDKMEKLLLVFKKNDVLLATYKKEGTDGRCEYSKNIVSIGDGTFNADNIGTLIHEYLHAMSGRDFLFEPTDTSKMYEIEEGMADTFSEVAFNMYIREHPEILTRLNIEDRKYRYVTGSCYDFENSIVRSLLYPLEKEHNDIEAIIEYALGNQNEFFKMILPKNIIGIMPRDQFGNVIFDTKRITREQLYEINRGAYLNLNRESIYCAKNHIISDFEEYDLQGVHPSSATKNPDARKKVLDFDIYGEYDVDETAVRPAFSIYEYRRAIQQKQTQNRWEHWLKRLNEEADKIPEGKKMKQEIINGIAENIKQENKKTIMEENEYDEKM